MKKLQLSAPNFSSVFVSLLAEVVQPLPIKARAGERPLVIELDDKRNAVIRLATAADMERGPEEHCLLVCRAEVLRPSSLGGFPAKLKKSLSSRITIGRQSKKDYEKYKEQSRRRSWTGTFGDDEQCHSRTAGRF